MDCECVGGEQANTPSVLVQLIPSCLTQISNTGKEFT